MLLFRSVAIGLLGACFLLLATHSTQIRVEREYVPVQQPRPAPAATIIDVAPGLGADQIAPLIRLAQNEHIIAVDDHPVADDLVAGTELLKISGRGFVDLTVGGSAGERRVLVLMH